jgi:hypothetical protein
MPASITKPERRWAAVTSDAATRSSGGRHPVLAAGFVLMALAAAPARAQPAPPDAAAIRSGLEEIFSLATFGALAVRDQEAVVTQSGAEYRVRLPLSGFASPPDAAIDAVVRPIASGLLDITTMTFPSAGTIEGAPAGTPSIISYAIGQQRITGKVDPHLAMPSSYEAEFGKIRLTSTHGDLRGEQTVDRYAVNGTISADAGGLVTLASQGNGTGFRLLSRGANGFASDSTVRALAGHFAVEGLNRAQGTRLMAAARGLAATTGGAGDRPPDLSPEQRKALRALIGAAEGLLNRVEVEETLEDVRFAVGAPGDAINGAIGRVRVNVTADAQERRLNSRFGFALDGISTTAAAGGNAAFIPHHMDMRTVLAGVRIGPLLALLRAATEPGAQSDALQAQATALFADPQTHVGIEMLSFDSGPLRVTGSARAVPTRNGQLGAEIHIAASGVDALLAQARTQPNLQGVMPMVFMAKGMGRPQGDNLIWDISLGDGALKINGVPFGQPPARTR